MPRRNREEAGSPYLLYPPSAEEFVWVRDGERSAEILDRAGVRRNR